MISAFKILRVVAPIVGGAAVLTWRIQETRTPVTAKKIVLPPLGMASGFIMFVSPEVRIPWRWGLAAFAVGALVLSYPLARTCSLQRAGDAIVMRRSRGFALILLGLVTMRIAMHDYLGHLLPPAKTAGILFVLAFGMLLRWRVGLYLKFRGFRSESAGPGAGAGRLSP